MYKDQFNSGLGTKEKKTHNMHQPISKKTKNKIDTNIKIKKIKKNEKKKNKTCKQLNDIQLKSSYPLRKVLTESGYTVVICLVFTAG